jgi:5-(carboxyamino)imidazole ribonucleotide synthase
MRLGVLGGGQLGRMLALAGLPLGMEFVFLDPQDRPCAAAVGRHLKAAYHDEAALAQLAEGADRVTYEFENVPASAVEWLAGRLPVYPPPAALRVCQDRAEEKTFLRRIGVPTAEFAPADTPAALEQAVERVGLPGVVKTRRMGYDGKGQRLVERREDLPGVWESLGGVPVVVETFVPFRRELSVIAVRGLRGETACYPVVQNHHEDGILRLSLAPAPELPPGLAAQAQAYARRALEALGYVGVLCVELFEVEGGLLANEMAPRVHNSGHWTVEGAQTSQFANHVRALGGLPLGDTSPRGCCAMVNLIGERPDFSTVLRVPGTHLHWYGKEPRPGRKVGHVTVCAESWGSLAERLEALEGCGLRVPGLHALPGRPAWP